MPEKQPKYYKIGQVSEILGVETHVLRFWETQFRQIRPKRIAKQRLYKKSDLEVLKKIKELLYERGYTIAGARKRLEQEIKNKTKSYSNLSDILNHLEKELEEIKKILD